jgi:hypothetical protein
VQPLHFRVPGFSHTRQERLGGCACDCACGWGPGSSVVSGFGDGGGSGTNGSGVGGGTSSSGADQAAPMTMKERKGEKARDKLHPRQAHRKLCGHAETIVALRIWYVCEDMPVLPLLSPIGARRCMRNVLPESWIYGVARLDPESTLHSLLVPDLPYAKGCMFTCPCQVLSPRSTCRRLVLSAHIWNDGLSRDLAPSGFTPRSSSSCAVAGARSAQGRCPTHGFAVQQSASPLRARPFRIPAADRLRSR